MATKITKIQVRRDVALNWESVNPILSVGEFGLETDSEAVGGSFKIGDGQTDWQNLDYFGAGEKGNFNEVTQNGPRQGGPGFPSIAPNIPVIDGLNITKYAASKVGTYTRGLGVYHHIFPVDGYVDTDNGNLVIEPTIGRPDARFSEVYVKGNSLHIGDDNDHEVILSHLPGATEAAVLKVAAVGPGGRVTELQWGMDSQLNPRRGKGYRVGQGLSVRYDSNFVTTSKGFGFRIDITAVDADGAILEYVIRDAGGGYIAQELLEVVLRSQLGIARREPFGDDFIVTELATAEALQQVTSQSLDLVGLGSPAAPYLQQVSRALPPTGGVVSQSDFNAWATQSLTQLDRQKLEVLNCTNVNNGDGFPKRETDGKPEYKLLINDTEGVIHPDFVNLRNTLLKGGEILYFNNIEEWEIVSNASGGGGGGIDEEFDPVFLQSTAGRLTDENLNGVNTIHYELATSTGLGGRIEPLLYMNNWDNVPAL